MKPGPAVWITPNTDNTGLPSVAQADNTILNDHVVINSNWKFNSSAMGNTALPGNASVQESTLIQEVPVIPEYHDTLKNTAIPEGHVRHQDSSILQHNTLWEDCTTLNAGIAVAVVFVTFLVIILILKRRSLKQVRK